MTITEKEIDAYATRFALGYVGKNSNLWHLKDDLIQEARIGVWTAAQKFSPDRGAAFATYAFWWMRQRCSNFVKAQLSAVRSPAKSMHHGPDSQFGPVHLEPSSECREIAQAIARVDSGHIERRARALISSRKDAACDPFEACAAVLKGDTQEEVAARSGVTRQAVSRAIGIHGHKFRRAAL